MARLPHAREGAQLSLASPVLSQLLGLLNFPPASCWPQGACPDGWGSQGWCPGPLPLLWSWQRSGDRPKLCPGKADLLWPSGPHRAPGPALCSSPQGLSRRLSEVSCVPGLPPSLMGPPEMPLPLLGQEGRDTARSLWTVPRHNPSDRARQGSGRHSPGGDRPRRAYAVIQQGNTLPRAPGGPGGAAWDP